MAHFPVSLSSWTVNLARFFAGVALARRQFMSPSVAVGPNTAGDQYCHRDREYGDAGPQRTLARPQKGLPDPWVQPAPPWNGHREHHTQACREREQCWPLEAIFQVRPQANACSHHRQRGYVLSEENERWPKPLAAPGFQPPSHKCE